MFCLTLQDIVLGWFDSEGSTLLTEEALKQAFLKCFNPWETLGVNNMMLEQT